LNPPQYEDLDVRGLVCSILHEYREGANEHRREFEFVDEHPYAIVCADRTTTADALRSSLNGTIRSRGDGIVIVRLYSTDEELCIDVYGEAIKPRGTATALRDASAPAAEDSASGNEIEAMRRRFTKSGVSFRARHVGTVAVFTIAFDRILN
jgi:hypothetical protein